MGNRQGLRGAVGMPDPAWARSFSSTDDACRTVRTIRLFCSDSCESCLRVMSMSAPVWAQPPLPRARYRTAGPGTGSSVPSPVVFRTALRERRAVERDGHPCPHLGWVTVLGVQDVLDPLLRAVRTSGTKKSCERRVVHAPSAHSPRPPVLRPPGCCRLPGGPSPLRARPFEGDVFLASCATMRSRPAAVVMPLGGRAVP